jgi:hypothetical protein
MKRFTPTLSTGILFSVLLVSAYSCGKEKIQIIATVPTPVTHTAPTVYAGSDISIDLPRNEVLLSGNYYGSSSDNIKTEWRKIAGPQYYSLEDKNSLKTRVMGLVEGIYYFELTIINRDSVSGRQVVRVTVVRKPKLHDPNVVVGTKEVTFKNIEWTYPWYNTLEAKDIYNYVPKDTPLNVFVRRGGSNSWIPVERFDPNLPYTNALYDYFIETRPDGAGMYTYGSLYVSYYGTDTSDTCEIKIQF